MTAREEGTKAHELMLSTATEETHRRMREEIALMEKLKAYETLGIVQIHDEVAIVGDKENVLTVDVLKEAIAQFKAFPEQVKLYHATRRILAVPEIEKPVSLKQNEFIKNKMKFKKERWQR